MMNARIGSVIAGLGLTATMALAAGPGITPTTVAAGPGITPVPFLDSAYPATEVKAMSANGEYVTYLAKDASNVTQVVYYKRGGSPVVVANPSGAAPTATGIDLRANGDLVIAGNIGGAMRDWHSSTGAWVTRYQADGVTLIGSSTGQNSLTVGTDGMTYYATINESGAIGHGLTMSGPQGQTQSYITMSGFGTNQSVNGVSATGRFAGRGKPTGTGNNRGYWTDTGGTPGAGVNLIPGFDNDPDYGTNNAEVYGISRDGDTLVGMSPDPYDPRTLSKQTPFVYKISTNTLFKAPLLPGTTSTSTFYAVSGDGKIAVGNNYGTVAGDVDVNGNLVSRDRGVLYDMRDPNQANWQLHSVKDYLAGLGVDMSRWFTIGRVYSISADGMDIAGYGLYDMDGDPATAAVSRGFIATIPEPATMVLLALGGLAAIRRRR